MSTLLYRAKCIGDVDYLLAELAYRSKIFAYNGFAKEELDRVIAGHGKQRVNSSVVDNRGVAVIPYYSPYRDQPAFVPFMVQGC